MYTQGLTTDLKPVQCEFESYRGHQQRGRSAGSSAPPAFRYRGGAFAGITGSQVSITGLLPSNGMKFREFQNLAHFYWFALPAGISP